MITCRGVYSLIRFLVLFSVSQEKKQLVIKTYKE